MADPKKRRAENVKGGFFVDSTCIDCGMCYWMSPGVFEEVGDLSAVVRQPSGEAETFRAAQSLVSCPVGSIGSDLDKMTIQKAIQSFPFPMAENVYHCGYHSRDSFGAASYLITRPQGNILVDSPRFVPQLVKNIESLGGVRWMFLTHRDDVADHKKFHDHFRCERILHVDDISLGTEEVEIKVTGRFPWPLDEEATIIPVPGHTRGHCVLHFQKRFLFTGDHLAWSLEKDSLKAFPDACWYSWPLQTESMKRLLPLSFEWVLPGHGAPHHAEPKKMHDALKNCIGWMETL